jgi:hypothetical protein
MDAMDEEYEPWTRQEALDLVDAYAGADAGEKDELCDEIGGVIDEAPAEGPDPACAADYGPLLALLGLPADELTAGLVEEVKARLAQAGECVVPELLRVSLFDPEPARERAGEVLDLMEGRQLIGGLIRTLAVDGGATPYEAAAISEVKAAAEERLVQLGPPAIDALAEIAREGALTALEAKALSALGVEVRPGWLLSEQPPLSDEELTALALADGELTEEDEFAQDAEEWSEEDGGSEEDEPFAEDESADDESNDDEESDYVDDVTGEEGAEQPISQEESEHVADPDEPLAAQGSGGDMDGEYQAFLKRFREESGQH